MGLRAWAVVAVSAAVCGAVSAGDTQDIDILVVGERFEGGRFEAALEVDAVPGLLSEVRFAVVGEPSVPLQSFEPDVFELDLEPDGTFEGFFTEDASDMVFDLQFVQTGGAISVYRITASDAVGTQVDPASLPGFATGLDLDGEEPATLSWQPPATPGDFLLVRGERPEDAGGPLDLFVVASPLPVQTPLLVQPPITLELADTQFTLPEGAANGPIRAAVSYGLGVGEFEPVLISGPPLEIGNAVAVAFSTTVARFDGVQGCPADLVRDGVLDIDDVLAFLGAFAASDPAADLAPPAGTLNIDDVLAFLEAFAAGCP